MSLAVRLGERRQVVGLSGPRLTVALVSGLVSVIMVGAGFAVWIGRSGAGPAVAAASSSPVSASTASVTADAAASAATSSAATAAGRNGSGSTGARSGPGTNLTALSGPSTNLTVQLTPAARAARNAEQVQSALQRYFDAINQHDHRAWAQSVTADLAAAQPTAQWTHAYSTTTDSTIWVENVLADPLRATVRFTSEQDLSLAPADLESTCITWRLTFTIDYSGEPLLIGPTVPGSVSKSKC